MQDEKLKQMIVEAYKESKYQFIFKRHLKRKNGIAYTMVGIYTYDINNNMPRFVASRTVNINVPVKDAIDDMVNDNQEYINDDNKDNFVACLKQLVGYLSEYRNNKAYYDAYLNKMISEL